MLTEQERELAKKLKQDGFSTDQIIEHIGSSRAGTQSPIDKKNLADFRAREVAQESAIAKPTQGGDAVSDIKEGFQGATDAVTRGIETANTAREQVTSGEISPVAGTVKTIGGGLKAGAEAIGSGVLSLLKLPFSQKTEQAVGNQVQEAATAVADTDIVQGAITKYNQLSPEQKAIVDGVLGTTEGLATMLGAGPASRAVSGSLKLTNNALRQGVDSIQGAAQEVAQFGSGAAGKSAALNLGFKPEEIMQRVARVSKKKQTDFQSRAGESIGEYLVNRDVFGSPDEIVDQLYSRMKDSKSRVDASIATVPGEFKAPQVKTALDDLIERDTRVSTEGAKSPDSNRIEQLYKKYNQKGLTLSEVNEVKRLYERNVRVDYLGVGAPSDKLVRATNIDSSLRNLVEDKASKAGVSTVRELNRETMLARQLMDDLGAEYAGSAGNNAIGLSDAIFLAEAMGNPVAAAGFIAKKVLSSKGVMSSMAKALSENAGSKSALPDVPVADPEKLTGYLKFLDEQSTGSVQ